MSLPKPLPGALSIIAPHSPGSPLAQPVRSGYYRLILFASLSQTVLRWSAGLPKGTLTASRLPFGPFWLCYAYFDADSRKDFGQAISRVYNISVTSKMPKSVCSDPATQLGTKCQSLHCQYCLCRWRQIT